MALINENWKPNFYKYEKVRRSGRYNMVMEAEKAIKACGRRARVEWERDQVYGTELSMILNHKCWYWYEEKNTKLSQLYAELWEEYHDWVLENWKGEDLGHYLRVTN